SVNPQDFEFDPGPMVIEFTSEQRRVKLFAGAPAGAPNHTLKAFDANGVLVAQDGPKPVSAGAFNTVFEVTTAGDKITRVEFLFGGNGGFEAIDDLEFDGKAPATVPTTPPVVQITSPANGAALDLDLNQIDVAGTVTGDGLLSPVTMTMATLRPPEQS